VFIKDSKSIVDNKWMKILMKKSNENIGINDDYNLEDNLL